jgi:alpha-tubulin suppressor-like RCC1 family protein
MVEGLSLSTGGSVVTVTTGSEHTCALLSDSTIQCWGRNTYGQLGRDTGSPKYSFDPEPVEGLSHDAGVSVSALSAGTNHTCALLSDSSIQCWGDNFTSQLGRDTGQDTWSFPMPVVTPAPVEGLSLSAGVAVSELTAGGEHTCVLLSDESILCWGYNSQGQLGHDTEDKNFSMFPILMEGLALGTGVTVSALSLGRLHSCVLLSDSSIHCCGSNSFGELGRDAEDAETRVDPEPVKGLSLTVGVTVVMLTAGRTHTCALLSDSSVQCWGYNESGQLGRDTGSQTFSRDPAPVDDLF